MNNSTEERLVESLPRNTASEAPVTRGYRIAFHIWVICFLLTLVVTLVMYLVDKFL